MALARYSLTPSFKAKSASCFSVRLERAMIGMEMVLRCCWSCSKNSIPEYLGSIMSRRIAFGCSLAASSRPLAPSPATLTLKPSFLNFRAYILEREGSSSTIRINGPPAATCGCAWAWTA